MVLTDCTWKEAVRTPPLGSIGWNPLSKPVGVTPSAPGSLEHGELKDDWVAVRAYLPLANILADSPSL